ncbi:MAG TPA: HlyD family secretion protein [Terriglobales bacterium]|nr:HlyD family secretion protein [Terriglobales bacterium]
MADQQTTTKPPAEVEPAPREPWPEETGPPPRGGRAQGYFRAHPRAKWVLLALLIIIIIAAYAVWSYYAARESTDDAQIDAHIVPISARVSGTVEKVNVDDNQYVEAGTVLVQLDPTDYQVALERARAELQDAMATLQAAQTGVPLTHTTTSSTLSNAQASLRAAQEEVSASQARLRESQAEYKLAADDVRRFAQLIKKEEIPQQRYDAAVTAEQQAAASVDAARAAVANAESHVAQAQAMVQGAETAPQQIAITRAKAGSAEANVARLKAALQQAELNLQYTVIRAPVTGIVSKKTVEPGEVIQAGQPVLALVNLEDVWVTANFKETQLKNMRPGQPAKIAVDAYGRTYNGHVDSIGGATGARFSLLPPENATGNYVKVVQRVPLKIVFEKGQDPHHLLRPGMSVVPTVLTK